MILSNQEIAGTCGGNLAVYGMVLFGGRLLRALHCTFHFCISSHIPIAVFKQQQPLQLSVSSYLLNSSQQNLSRD